MWVGVNSKFKKISTLLSLLTIMSDRGNVHSNQDHAFCSPIPDRGRSYYRTRQSQWSREKQYVPGLPPFLPSTIPKDELDALLVRFRIEEIGYKLQNNLLDLELRARYVIHIYIDIYHY